LVAWEQEFDTDIATTGKLKLTTPQFIGDFKSLSRDELEAKLVELHGLDGRARRIKEKYTTVVAADDSDRVFLRDNAHANFRAEISAPHVQGKKLLGG
jgi:hypothetical protein